MIYACCDESCRDAVREFPGLNGIDFLEVVDNPADPVPVRQTVLAVHLINDFRPADLPALTVRIEGGDRIRAIAVTNVSVEMPPPGPPPAPVVTRVLSVTVDRAGDYSTYTLRFVRDKDSTLPPPGFDPILSAIDFSFKVSCTSDFDCEPAPCPPEKPVQAPTINYLAKDYASFRQLMLDRMALLVPDWQERNPADLGITLIEMLAYVGDYLSYQQDAIGTEAYLATARRRTSVRRHARLVDYFMHDGCNARVWVQVQVDLGQPPVVLRRTSAGLTTQFLTRVPGLEPNKAFTVQSADYQKALAGKAKIFELMHDETLFGAHNEMAFYTWGNGDCCLPTGATQASLAGHFPDLKPGQVLILAEVRGPKTGLPQDADPTHRYAVRLVDVQFVTDPLGVPASPPLAPPEEGLVPDGIVPLVTTIQWHDADALPVALCLSSHNGTSQYDHVSVALGNIVLADHGRTLTDTTGSSLLPDTVPSSVLNRPGIAASHCDDSPEIPIPARYRPQLNQGPLTQTAPFDPADTSAPASAAMRWSVQEAMPVIQLREQTESVLSAEIWAVRRDLLESKPTSREFVAEPETDGVTYIRFGNAIQGAQPVAGTTFLATYRVGNGTEGNIGAEKLTHIATSDASILTDPPSIRKVWNPLPAQGGTAPETMEEVRQKAPAAFKHQKRAVTPHDYEEMARTVDDTVQRAACTFRWTGSWRTAFLSVDRLGGQTVDAPFGQRMRRGLEPYRMAGYDLDVEAPRYVSLEIEMVVCVDRAYFASDVKAALLLIFNRHYQPNGQTGLLHPDRFTFGQTVFLSPFYAAAQSVAEVLSVEITTFRRQGSTDADALDAGKIKLGRLEIARLDNDPNFPDHGLITLIMKGGR